jgi:hypothetical protein
LNYFKGIKNILKRINSMPVEKERNTDVFYKSMHRLHQINEITIIIRLLNCDLNGYAGINLLIKFYHNFEEHCKNLPIAFNSLTNCVVHA